MVKQSERKTSMRESVWELSERKSMIAFSLWNSIFCMFSLDSESTLLVKFVHVEQEIWLLVFL